MRTREDILWEIEHHTKDSQLHTSRAEFLSEFLSERDECKMNKVEYWAKRADYHNNRANKAKQELKEFDEANK